MLHLKEGLTVNLRKLFGDINSVVPANLLQDTLVWCLRWLMMEEWQLGSDCREWINRLLQLDWVEEITRRWIRVRAGIFKLPSAPNYHKLSFKAAKTEMHRFWNIVPVAIGAFFDDKFSGTGERWARDVTGAVFTLMDEGEVEGSLEKFERFKAGGYRGVLNPTTRKFEREATDGDAVVLGRAFYVSPTDYKADRMKDRPEVKAETAALLSAVLAAASASATGLVATAAGLRLRGQLNWLLGTEPTARSLLQGLSKALAAAQCGFMPHLLKRRAQRFVMAKAAFQTTQQLQGRKVDWCWKAWGLRQFFVLPRATRKELQELMQILMESEGVAFLPRRSPVPLDEIAFVQNDCAGAKKDARGVVIDDGEERAGAAYIFNAACARVRYIQEPMPIAVLTETHSTAQEMSNGEANAEQVAAAERFAHVTVIAEVYDSQSSMGIWRRMRAKRRGMQQLLDQRRKLLRELRRRSVRLITLWNKRELQTIPDLLSKMATAEARRRLKWRFPHKKIDKRRWRREPCLLSRGPR